MTENTQAFCRLLPPEVIALQPEGRWLFGPNSVLNGCKAEIPAVQGTWMRALNSLPTDHFAPMYERRLRSIGNGDKETRKELRNELLAQIAATFSGYRAGVGVLSGADVKEELPKLAGAYDKAWPLRKPYRRADKTGDPVFDKAFSTWPTGASLGYWIARHLYAESKDHGLLPAQGTGVTPVLFADLDGRVGKIGRLTVELFAGAGPLIPDPFSLGLTLLSRGEHGFHEALQRAWWRSGLSGQDLHARWRIEPYQPTDPDALAVPILHGRSVEAAVCCALWAAYGGIPTRDAGRRTQVELDDHAVVTAMFADATAHDYESPTPPAKPAEAPLKKVGNVPAKLDSVKASAIELVVVHKDQKIDRTDQDEKAGLHIESVTTIGEAFNALWALERCRRAYQQAQIKPFREKFYFPREEEPEAATARAEGQ